MKPSHAPCPKPPSPKRRAEYRRLLTQAYDIDKPSAPPEELAFYRAHVEQARGPVLEVMCGSGRFLVPLLQAGADIDGVDASEDMLDACRQRCQSLGLSTDLSLQELEQLEVRRAYELILCGGGSFGLLADIGDAEAALRRMRDALAPGGSLLLEVETPSEQGGRGAWGGRWWRRPDGAIIVLRDLGRDVREGVEEALGIYELYVDGALVETELNEWVRRFWTPRDIAAALEAVGFHEVRITRAFDSAPLDGAEPIVSVRARR